MSSEQLDATIAGTYGSIRDTLQHIVIGEHLYFAPISTGQRYDPPEYAPPLTLAEMVESVHTTGGGLMEWAPKVQAGDTVQDDGDGTPYDLPKTILLTRAINHATEHRAQIMAILTQLGIQPPELDGWTYLYERDKKRPGLLNGLQEEYQQWEGLLDQIGPAHMDQPGVTGHWSIKDIVAHLAGWRRRTVARLQAAGRGEPEPPPAWPAQLQTDDEINAWIYESNHGRSVREVLDESQQVFQQLLAAIEDLPDDVLMDPVHHLPWLDGQPFSAGEFFAHFHEEHEPDMRAWLRRVKKQ